MSGRNGSMVKMHERPDGSEVAIVRLRKADGRFRASEAPGRQQIPFSQRPCADFLRSHAPEEWPPWNCKA